MEDDLMDKEEQSSGLGFGALFGDDEVEDVQEEVVIAEATEIVTEEVDVSVDIDMVDAFIEQELEAVIEEPVPAPAARKTLEEAADSLVSALERHIEEDAKKDVPSTSSAGTGGRNRYMLPIENLYPSRFQPRRIFSDESIDELSKSIRQYGVLQPLLVRKDPDNADGYEIIAGERRWRASQKAQIHEMPVVVLELNELEAHKIALIENLQREDLNPIDEALGYQKLLEEFGQTQDQLAAAVGKSRPHITNMVRLLALPSTVQARLGTGDLTMGHARALIGADNAEELAKKVISKGLSVRQTEKLVADARGYVQEKRPRTASPKPEKDADTRALENDISNALGMAVSIDSSDGKSGVLSVEFKSLDQLDEVLHRLAHFPGARLSG